MVRVVDRFRRLLRLTPQLAFFDKILFAFSILIERHLQQYVLKDAYGGYAAEKKPYLPYQPSSKNSGQVYKTLVCVSGSGYSGSGAILDLLEEYDEVTAQYNREIDSGSEKRGIEFDLLRQFGGVFWLEDIFDHKHFEPMKNGAILLFLNLIEFLHIRAGSIFNEEFIDATRRFLDRLIVARYPNDCRVGTAGWYRTFVHCPNLCILGNGGARLLWGNEGCAFVLKDLSIEEYRTIANEYIHDVLGSIISKRFLVLDQAVSDYSYDFRKYRDYLGNGVKYIFAVRDPRDVYVTGRLLDEKWVPSDPSAFVQWFAEERGVRRCFKIDDPDALVVRFEDLVLHYDVTVERIERHIGLNPAMHTRKFSCFSPCKSEKNVGSYKNFPDREAISYIGEKLSDLCYPLA